jgi:hypothetical protein
VIIPPSGTDAAALLQAEIAAGTLVSDLYTDGVEKDKSLVTSATVPSLRIERGGVKLPDNVVNVPGGLRHD